MQESLTRMGRFDPQRARDRLLSAFSPAHTRHIVLNGERVGFVVVKPHGDGLRLDHLYIKPGHQGQGVGAAVLADVLARADRQACDVQLTALRGSEANRFYLRHGFVLVEQTEFDNLYQRKPQKPETPTPMHQTFTVQRIDHLVLRVADLDHSIGFYGSVLGCEVVRECRDLGLIYLRAGASMIDLVDVQGKLGRLGGAAAGVEGRNVDHLCLRVEPFDEARIVQHLAAFGVQPLGPASVNFGAEGDGLSLYFQDPDGNTLELKGTSTPATVQR